MVRALVLTLSLCLLPLTRASANGPADLGANAALKYWQAFAQLPKLSDAEQSAFLSKCLTMPLDSNARQLVSKSEYALLMMRRGASLRDCEWAVGSEEGIAALLPHMQASRMLASLAALRARVRFAEGRTSAAVDDTIDGMILARHTSQGGLLIPVLVRYAIEGMMTETLARNLPKLDAAAARDVRRRLGALPAGGRPATALKLEERFSLDWFERELNAKDKDQVMAMLTGLTDSAEKAREFYSGCGGTKEGVLKCIELARPSYDRLAPVLDLPFDQCQKEYDAERKKQAANPVFTTFFPPIDHVRLTQARADVKGALLLAAIAVQIDGPEALKDHRDPITGEPFDMVKFDGGYELRLRWKAGDNVPAKLREGFTQPPGLVVGERKP